MSTAEIRAKGSKRLAIRKWKSSGLNNQPLSSLFFCSRPSHPSLLISLDFMFAPGLRYRSFTLAKTPSAPLCLLQPRKNQTNKSPASNPHGFSAGCHVCSLAYRFQRNAHSPAEAKQNPKKKQNPKNPKKTKPKKK